MPEIVTFAAAVNPPQTVFRVAVITFDYPNAHITVILGEWNGTAFTGRLLDPIHYTGDVATTLMRALNKANLSTQSLQQRVMAQLLADGKIPSGTASGTPD